MNTTSSFKKHWIDIFAIVLFLLIPLIFIWSYRFFPSQDYPDHVFTGYLLSLVFKGEPMEFYQLLAYPVPNSVSSVVIGIFDLFLQPEISGKLFITLALLLFAHGAFYLVNSFQPGKISPLSYIPFILIPGFPLFHGQLNYIFSLGILSYTIGYMVRKRDRLKEISRWRLFLLSTLLYFSHATSFFFFIVFS